MIELIYIGVRRPPGARRKYADEKESYRAKLAANKRWRARNRQKHLAMLKANYQARKARAQAQAT